MGKGEMPERVWLCTHGPSTSNSWKEISDGEVYCPKGGPYVLASLYDAACERVERMREILETVASWHDEAMKEPQFEAYISIERDFPRGDLDAALAAEKDK